MAQCYQDHLITHDTMAIFSRMHPCKCVFLANEAGLVLYHGPCSNARYLHSDKINKKSDIRGFHNGNTVHRMTISNSGYDCFEHRLPKLLIMKPG